MAYLGIDWGQQHLGLAVGYENGLVCPLTTISFHSFNQIRRELEKIISAYAIEIFFLGRPSQLSRPQQEKLEQFARWLKKQFNYPLYWVNEDFTSAAARDKLAASGVSPREKKAEHALAAKFILEEGLEQLKNEISQ